MLKMHLDFFLNIPLVWKFLSTSILLLIVYLKFLPRKNNILGHPWKLWNIMNNGNIIIIIMERKIQNIICYSSFLSNPILAFNSVFLMNTAVFFFMKSIQWKSLKKMWYTSKESWVLRIADGCTWNWVEKITWLIQIVSANNWDNILHLILPNFSWLYWKMCSK